MGFLQPVHKTWLAWWQILPLLGAADTRGAIRQLGAHLSQPSRSRVSRLHSYPEAHPLRTLEAPGHSS